MGESKKRKELAANQIGTPGFFAQDPAKETRDLGANVYWFPTADRVALLANGHLLALLAAKATLALR